MEIFKIKITPRLVWNSLLGMFTEVGAIALFLCFLYGIAATLYSLLQ
jgi:hypothetical protein